MSEYQYYEFQAIDRPLTRQEQAELRALSTRAEISSTHFTNVYHFGNFKGSPDKMMERYFDAHVYTANWGTRVFMLRLPRKLFDPRRAAPYVTEDRGLSLRATREHVILTFSVEEEPGDWEDTGDDWLARLLPLRSELLHGDLRCLYLAWISAARAGDLDEEETEPPVPPGLRTLSGSQQALADFLGIGRDLLGTLSDSGPEAPARRAPSRKALSVWLRALPASDKNAVLLRLMEGREPHLGTELLQRFHDSQSPAPQQVDSNPRRTVGQLREAARAWREAQQRRTEAQRAREQALRERVAAAAREKALQALAAREAAAWKEVDAHFATRKPKGYDTGVQLLRDLGEVARRQGREAEFLARVHTLRALNASKSSLISRLGRAGL